MAAEITIPRLGWSMEEGIFVRWLKQDGDWVSRGDQLFLLESEKATQEIESLDEGLLHIPPTAPAPGDAVLVGQVIALLLAKGESAPTNTASPSQPTAQRTESAAGATTAPAVAGPAARRLARRLNVPLDDVPGSGRGGRVTTGDILARAESAAQDSPLAGSTIAPGSGQSSPPVSPRARRVARELGVDATNLTGSGRNGRVRERDVRAAAGRRPVAARGGTQVPPQDKTGSIRRTIARRMVASHQSTAPVTLTSRADATNLVNLREQFKATTAGAEDIVPSFTDLIVKLVSLALARHPLLNSRWEEDAIVMQDEIHIGIAVDTPNGLLVPVVRDVPRQGIREIAQCARSLVEHAREGTLSHNELQGGTFTVTNLGNYGIDAFTPIINPPEAAILGVGAIRREPVYDALGQLVPRELFTLSLTFDHRIVDGAPAARFLQTLVSGIENPAAWLSDGRLA